TQSVTIKSTVGYDIVSQAAVTGSGFSISGPSLPVMLSWGRTVTFNVTFTPQSSGAVSGRITILGNGSVPSLTIPLTGNGGATAGSLSVGAPTLKFGSVPVGSSQTLSETLTNSGGSSVTISQATATGAYGVSGLGLPATLAAGQSTSFSVKFTPTTGGSASGNLLITSNASNPSLSVPLSGLGVTSGSLTATPPSLSFGSVQVGSSQTLSETLTNSGGSSVTVTQANVTGAGFSITGLTLPLTLSPGQSFTFGAVFTPTSGGSASGNIAVVSNASNPNLAISMSGSGALAGQLTITPGTLSFGSVVVGQSKSMTTTLNATGSSVVVSSASVGSSEFVVGGPSLPLTIQSGQSGSFSVTFHPKTSGPAS